MKILIVHEIDWLEKVPFEPHHLSELFSIAGNDVFVIDCAQPNLHKVFRGIFTSKVEHFHRLYPNASITLIHPSSLLIKGFNRLTHFFSCKKTMKKIITENNIDLILLYGVAANGIQCIELSSELNIPLVFRSLDVAHEFVKIPILHNLVKKNEKIILNRATRILSTTPELVRYAKEMGASENVHYFPLGIHTNFFKPVSKIQSLMQQLDLKNSDKVIGFIGTLYSFAGLDFLIKNFSMLKSQINEIKFVIVGGGPDFGRIKSLINQLHLENDVILTGFVKQEKLFEYISLFDICVNPFVIKKITTRIIPTKILEYLACGKPVLSTPLPGTVELLPDESYGIVYSPLNEFIPSLVNLLKNKEKLNKLGKDGLLYIEKNHHWDKLSKNLLAIFEDVILKNNSLK